MSNILTEEELIESDLTFLAILESFIDDNYEVDEDYEMTEENLSMVLSLKEYFNESFKVPSASDMILEDITSYDTNSSFYYELNSIMMDESIGKAVAGAMYHIKPLVSKLKADAARRAFQKASQEHERMKTVQTQKTSQAPDKSAFQRAKEARIGKRVAAAGEARAKALSTQRAAIAKQGNIEGRKTAMGNKIDTAIQQKKENIIKRAGELKDKAKNAIRAGKDKVAGFFGDIAGRLA